MVKLLKSIKDNFFYLAICFLLFFIPLYPKFPLFSVSETYVSIRLEDVFIALIVGLFALRLLIKKDFSLLKDNLTKLVFLFFSVGFVSLLSAIFITKNVVPHLAFLHFLRRIEYISLLFVAYYSVKNIKQLKTYGWIVLLATFGVIVYGLGQKFFGWPVVSTMNKEFSKGLILRLTWWARVNSTFAGHYDLASYVVMILSLTAASFILLKSWKKKIIVGFVAILSYYILILTASRVSFGAYLVGTAFVLWFSNKKWWLIPFFVFSILGMVFSDDLGQRYAATFNLDLSFLSGKVAVKETEQALVPTLTPTLIPTPTPKKEKPGIPAGSLTPTDTPTPTPEVEPEASGSGEPIESTALAVGRSTDIRLKVEWPRAIRAFLKNPFLGTGYSSISLATDNDYLRLLGEIGLLGALAFGAVIIEIARRMLAFVFINKAHRGERIFVVGVIGASIGYFLNATFIDVFEASKVAFFFWIMIGVSLKVIDLSNTKSNKN